MPDDTIDIKLGLIQQALSAGETLVASCDFTQGLDVVTAVVTNQNFWCFRIKSNWIGRNIRIVSSSQISLGSISEVTTWERDGNVGLTLMSAGSRIEFETFYHAAQARVFIAETKRMLALQSQRKSGINIADELEKLAQLKKDGVLSVDDFERAKVMFLGKPPDMREQSIGLLRNLYALHRSGVLSQSEFNLKKWDILSKRE